MAITSYGNIHGATWKDRVLNATAENITGTAGIIYGAVLDNTANSAASYCKIFLTTPTLGTTHPAMVLRVPAATKLSIPFGADGSGVTFDPSYFVVGVTTGGLAGSTSPTSSFLGTFYTDS